MLYVRFLCGVVCYLSVEEWCFFICLLIIFLFVCCWQSGFGWYVIPGNFFSIGMTSCTLTYTSKMELVDVTRGNVNPTTSSPESDRMTSRMNKCSADPEPDVQLVALSLPYRCAALNFQFFGGLTDALVNTLGLTLIRILMRIATKVVRDQVNFLLCS